MLFFIHKHLTLAIQWRQMKSTTQKNILLLFIIILFAMVACTDDDTGTITNIRDDGSIVTLVPNATIFFPQQEAVDGEREVMEAELFGELVLVEDCIRVNHDESDVSYVLIWPPDFTLSTEKDVIEVFSDTTVVHVGDEVRISGGEITYLSEQEKSKLSPNCLGPYWIVGSEVSMIGSEKAE